MKTLYQKWSLKQAFKETMKELRIKNEIKTSQLAQLADTKLRTIYNYEYNLQQSMYLTAIYFDTFITKKGLINTLPPYQKDFTQKNKIIHDWLNVILEDKIKEDINIISELYGTIPAYLDLFFTQLLDDEYALMIILHFYFLGGYEKWQAQTTNIKK